MNVVTSPRARAELVRRARHYAALSAPFRPDALLDALDVENWDDVRAVGIELASICDTSDPGRWLIRESARQGELDLLAADDALAEAVEWRREFDADDPTKDLLDAIAGNQPFRASSIELLSTEELHRAELTRILAALDRAGAHAPAGDLLPLVRASLGRFDDRARRAVIRDTGSAGRDADVAQADDWLARTHPSGALTALFVTGAPDSGKSAFVAALTARALAAAQPWIPVRLDFERAGLDVQDQIGLVMEISRQVTREVGAAAMSLRTARLDAAGTESPTGPLLKGGGRERLPEELVTSLSDTVQRSGRRVLLVLDSFEMLAARGATHPQRVFETLDVLRVRGLDPIAVVVAGVPNALDAVPDRIGDRITLRRGRSAGMTADAVPPRSPRRTRGRAQRAAALAQALERGDLREAEHLVAAGGGEPEYARAFLWRAGRWSEALEGFDARRHLRSNPVEGSPAVVLAHLEMCAETSFDAVVGVLRGQPETASAAATLSASAMAGALAGGALDFALLRAGVGHRGGAATLIDPVDAAAALWADDAVFPSPRVIDALSAELGVIVSRWPDAGPFDLVTAVGAARLLAASTPYAAVAQTMLDLGGPESPLARRLHTVPRTNSAETATVRLEQLVAAGEFSEGLSAAAFGARDLDLSLLARSAERWRRTAAGDWAYSSHGVPDTAWTHRLDVTIASRIAALETPADAAADLARWTNVASEKDAFAFADKVRRRFRAASRDVRRLDALAAASVYLEHGVPSAFVPSLVIIERT